MRSSASSVPSILPGMLNPGKVIPTLHRCAEYGRMRVTGGAMSFPELPRF